jgi:glutamate transport system permease protein
VSADGSATRVLFDAPGPRARARIRLATVASVLVAAGLLALVLVQFGRRGQLQAEKWAQFGELPILTFLAKGLANTLLAAAVSAVISIPLGALFSVLRLSLTRWVRWPVTAYIEVFRSIPTILLLYFFIAGPFSGLPIFWKLVIPIVLGNIAILAEIFRAGVQALPRGQFEAGQAIGLGYWANMTTIVFPQALRLVVPALVTQLVALIKDTTLGYVVSYAELMKSATNLTAYTGYLIQTYLVVGLIYVLINFALSKLAEKLERTINGGRRGVRLARVLPPTE